MRAFRPPGGPETGFKYLVHMIPINAVDFYAAHGPVV